MEMVSMKSSGVCSTAAPLRMVATTENRWSCLLWVWPTCPCPSCTLRKRPVETNQAWYFARCWFLPSLAVLSQLSDKCSGMVSPRFCSSCCAKSRVREMQVISMLLSFFTSWSVRKKISKSPSTMQPTMWRVGRHRLAHCLASQRFLGHLNFAWSIPSILRWRMRLCWVEPRSVEYSERRESL